MDCAEWKSAAIDKESARYHQPGFDDSRPRLDTVLTVGECYEISAGSQIGFT